MSSDKRLPFVLLLLLTLGAAMLGAGVLHKMRECRVFSVLLQEHEQQLMSLQVLLEIGHYCISALTKDIERAELKNKVMDSETTKKYLTNTQKELEAALMEKESYINQMKQIAAASGPDQVAAIKELLQQKDIAFLFTMACVA